MEGACYSRCYCFDFALSFDLFGLVNLFLVVIPLDTQQY
jgi:hypothetical protein